MSLLVVGMVPFSLKKKLSHISVINIILGESYKSQTNHGLGPSPPLGGTRLGKLNKIEPLMNVLLGGGFTYFLCTSIFHPFLGKWSILTIWYVSIRVETQPPITNQVISLGGAPRCHWRHKYQPWKMVLNGSGFSPPRRGQQKLRGWRRAADVVVRNQKKITVESKWSSIPVHWSVYPNLLFFFAIMIIYIITHMPTFYLLKVSTKFTKKNSLSFPSPKPTTRDRSELQVITRVTLSDLARITWSGRYPGHPAVPWSTSVGKQ